MTVLLFAVVIGWSVLLTRLVKLARADAEMASSPSSVWVMFCWVPIVSIAGILFPGLFLGKGVTRKLTDSDKSRWTGYIRLGCVGYLVLLFGGSVLLAASGIR